MPPMLSGRGAWIAGTQGGGPSVSMLGNGQVNSLLNNTCYAGVHFGTDGEEDECSATTGSFTQNVNTWLLSGNASDVWIERTVTGGSWNSLDPGTGRHQITTNRAFRVIRTATGIQSVTGSFEMWDAASGGNSLDTTSSATYSAENEFDPCPICCFTPETPITMESGLQMPIGKIRKGDRILVWNPRLDPHEAQYGEEVTGIIDRVNRTMYRVTFEDGRHLDMSEDHPLHIEDKGPHSIYPTVEYKDVGLPEVLQVGDHASRLLLGTHSIVKSIEPIPYRGVVYTLENTLFYANGILVY